MLCAEQLNSRTEELNTSDQELAYTIVHAFLGQLIWHNAVVEGFLAEVIHDERRWSPDMLQRIDGIFTFCF